LPAELLQNKGDKSGIFKITAQFLRDNGINPSSVNPKNFRIYGNGGIMLPEFNQDPDIILYRKMPFR
jgi:hypothetical protein